MYAKEKTMSKKRKTPSGVGIRGTHYLTQARVETNDIRSLILRRRLQVLVHSCIYYELNENIVADSTWSAWAEELAELQKQYPKIADRVDYAKEFKDFDGSTGFHLPTRNPEIMAKAKYLLKICKERDVYVRTIRYQNCGADPEPDVIRICFPL
jgi:hypothetical protein